MNLRGSDEALAYLENHPRAAAIAEAGNAILEDPMQLKELERKIDRTTAMLLTAVYFLQFLDKTTLSYTAVMEIRTDTHLKRQDYSDLSMLFNIVAWPFTRSDSLVSRSGISYAISRPAYITSGPITLELTL